MTLVACGQVCHRTAHRVWHHPALHRIVHHAATLPSLTLGCCAGAAWLAVPHLAAAPPPVPVAAPPPFEHAGLAAWYAPPGGYDLTQVPLAGFGGAYAGASVPELPAVADLSSVPIPLSGGSSTYGATDSSGGSNMRQTHITPQTEPGPRVVDSLPVGGPVPLGSSPVPEPAGLAVVAVALAGLAAVRRRA